MRWAMGLLLIVFFPALSWSMSEAEYESAWCQGEEEHVFEDQTRCDCLTETHAIEIKFADKWYAAVGQALFYALQSGKRPGIALILENESEFKYWLRLNSTINYHNLDIDTWVIHGYDLQAR